MLKVLAVVQARMGSSRLPGKALLPLADRPVLGWVLRAVKEVRGVDEVVVATSIRPEDDVIAAVASDYGVDVVRGSEDDVLSRFIQAMDGRQADGVARFTADCPLLDPVIADMVIATWRACPELDHVSTAYPRCLPRGLDAEIASADALRRLDRELRDADSAHHRIHVTSALYLSPATSNAVGLVLYPRADDLRLTLDTPEDWDVIGQVVSALGDRTMSWREVVTFMRAHPELSSINSDIVQKPLNLG